jgi:cytochrome c oxidase cbb3-type subunit 4
MDLISLYPAIKSLWTVWLVVLFAGILLWTLRPARRPAHDRAATIPLRDDASVE